MSSKLGCVGRIFSCVGSVKYSYWQLLESVTDLFHSAMSTSVPAFVSSRRSRMRVTLEEAVDLVFEDESDGDDLDDVFTQEQLEEEAEEANVDSGN